MKRSSTLNLPSDANQRNFPLRAAFAVALSIFATTGCGDGNPPPITAPDPANAPAFAEIDAYAAVLVFREAAINDPVGAVRSFTSSHSTGEILPEFLDHEIGPVIWSSYMAGTIAHVGASRGASPVTALYHPWSDTALLLRWELGDRQRAVIESCLVPGNWFREEEDKGGPPWLRPDATEAFPILLMRQHRGFEEGFLRWASPEAAISPEFPQRSVSEAGRGQAGQLAAAQLSSLVEEFESPRTAEGEPLGPSVAELLAALDQDAKAEDLARLLPSGNPWTATQFLTLPSPIRSEMIAFAVVSSDSRRNVVLSHRHAPAFFAVAEFEKEAARLVSFTGYSFQLIHPLTEPDHANR